MPTNNAEKDLLSVAEAGGSGHPLLSRPPRSWHRVVVCAFVLLQILLNVPYFFPSVRCPSTTVPSSIDERVTKILTDTPLIDGHNDLAIVLRYIYSNHINDDKFRKPWENGGTLGAVDLPRLRAGHYGGAFWSVFVGCPENATDLSDGNYREVVQQTLEQIDVVTRLRDAYPEHFSPNVNSSTALAAFKDKGQLISPMGVEGLHQIGNSVGNLRLYHTLGVRYATLSWNCPNKYADAALWDNPLRVAPSYWGGVSKLGQQLVREMNRLGMLVDLAHTSVETMEHVLGGKDDWEGSRAPPIFSHSSAHAVCPHPRNVPDHVLQLVKKRNSLVMVNFSPDFVSCKESADGSGLPEFYPPNSTLSHVVTHIMHIGSLIGFDHVGLGSDFDGIPTVPEGLEDVSKFPDLVAEMLRRGVSDEDAAKVVGGNLLRVWAEADAVALEMQAEGVPPMEDDLQDLPVPTAM